jgi:aryl-alcohol dehydrogenase-like predicted oxidoreductase
MPLSVEGRPDAVQARSTIRAALEAGVTFLDTADSYHALAGEVGHNELIVADALAAARAEGVFVATKGGLLRPGDGTWGLDGRPEHLKRAARASAERLGVEAIDLFQFHRPDPAVPFEESIGALAELLDEGVIRAAGLSNATADQIRIARRLLADGLVSVQNRFNPFDTSSLPELRLCGELGLAFLPWSPLGRPTTTGTVLPSEFERIGRAHGVGTYQVVLAWEMALEPVVIPIPGARRAASIVDSAKAGDLELSPEELLALDGAVGITA